ncbi:hypothetical protein HMPREF0970_00398 [Schaalia odontolytica F0309]|uniref:Uncharacterized protein n=1 Tax=Schaalia odontolytica F0309 TaxID=649742 RepID=D4TWT7_9ACTO|nr:hypothetical protein HMPREF0970_00398 [Schaalia odontolytica F0309]
MARASNARTETFLGLVFSDEAGVRYTVTARGAAPMLYALLRGT